MVPLFELERAYEAAKSDLRFNHDSNLLKNFAGRPTPLQFASRLTEKLGDAHLFSSAKICFTRRAPKSITPSAGPARREDGQAAHHRGNGSGPARRRFRNCRRATRPRMRSSIWDGRNMARQALKRRAHAYAWHVKSWASSPAAARSRTPLTKPCAIGHQRSNHAIIYWGPFLGAHPYPTMVRDFQPLSAAKRASNPRSAESASTFAVGRVRHSAIASMLIISARRRPCRNDSNRTADRRNSRLATQPAANREDLLARFAADNGLKSRTIVG